MGSDDKDKNGITQSPNTPLSVVSFLCVYQCGSLVMVWRTGSWWMRRKSQCSGTYVKYEDRTRLYFMMLVFSGA